MKYNIGKNLKRLRHAKNYTQEQVAQELGISPKSLSRWECDTTLPDVMILPELARLYGVTVDDLYRDNSMAYENYASRLLSVYESSRDLKDFINAEYEYRQLYKNEKCTMNDLRGYGILYQYQMLECKKMALKLFQKGLDRGVENDPDVYHQIERQRMLLRSQIGDNEENIKESRAYFEKNPQDVYGYINLLVAYLLANDNQNALEVYLESIKKFPREALLYAYGGDVYEELNMREHALKCWNKTLELDPEITAALWSKASCYEDMENYQAAYQVWMELIEWLEEKGLEIEVQEPKKRAENCRNKIQEMG